LELSPLLFAVASCLDGRRDLAEIAETVAGRCNRPVTADNVAYLIEKKLRPLQVLRTASDPTQEVAGGAPLLGLQLRAAVVPRSVVRGLTWLLRPLFSPLAVAVVLLGLLATDAWILVEHLLGSAVGASIYRPGVLLMFVGLTLLGGAFHELGHATATRYGGAEPGAIGAGIYLIWPVFYNDLSDTYRLSRAGRLRADLGGVYFNAVFVVAMAAIYVGTGFSPLLLAIAIQHLAMAQQFLPFVRLDGYYLVSDLAGVPDLFGHIRPSLARLLPDVGHGRRPSALTRRAQVIVSVWVVVTVPLLLAGLALLVWSSPHLVRIGSQAFAMERAALVASVDTSNVVGALLSGVELMVLAVPVVGLTAALAHAIHRGARLDRRPTPPLFIVGLGALICVLISVAGLAIWDHHPGAGPTPARTAPATARPAP
jgi:putative peptide zinc metalloprotease protein